MKKEKRIKDGLVSGALETNEDALKIIKSIQSKYPKKSYSEGFIVPKKLWKKIKKFASSDSLLSR